MIRTEIFSTLQEVQSLAPQIVCKGYGIFRNSLIFCPGPWINLPIQEEGAELTLTELGVIQVGLQELILLKGWMFILSPEKAFVAAHGTQYVADGSHPVTALLKAFYLALQGEENGGE